MNCKLITVASHLEVHGLSKLVESLEKFHWEFCVLQTEWKGFGTKLLTVRDFLLSHPDITHFFFCDAYDCVVLSTMEEALSKIDVDKITVSGEKNCWPDSSLWDQYSPNTEWAYVNSGLYFAPRDKFLKLFEVEPPEYCSDDQLWFTKKYLFGKNGVELDEKCNTFQNYSFISDGDFDVLGDRLLNLKTGTMPVFVHGNGRTDLTKIYELI